MVVAPSTSRAAFACGGVVVSPIYGGRGPHIFLCPHFPSRDNDARCRHRENESEFVEIILRQLPERYDVVKTMTLANPRLTRPRLENTIRSVYSQRKAHEIAKQWPAVGVPAEPSSHPDGMVSRGGGIIAMGFFFAFHSSPMTDSSCQKRFFGCTGHTLEVVYGRKNATTAYRKKYNNEVAGLLTYRKE